ncbi:arginine--tRNA ligase [candidate division WOR-3 bacterium]|uniref:Arginine--tRNA ligase n=1 Tax=candidate division WOR-3 bacterium TaxID=2052148 RepID=A0A937XHN5_UNCW3|nr:arginine--tRNA ligase [candidate division WOR-3 bacterium]
MPDTGYYLTRCREELVGLLAAQGVSIAPAEVRDVEGGIEADLAVPLFRIAKERGENPQALAERLAGALQLEGTRFASATALKGYLNLGFNRARFAQEVIADFSRNPERYGSSGAGMGHSIVIDYSSPNIAKPFSVGHLRSTIIGQALHNILSFLGYQVIGDNHLGDWGTQFGKLLCAFNRWGSEEELERNPTAHLLSLYVRFHEEAKANAGLELEARDWFRRLETGDDNARSLWQRFVKLSTTEFGRIYDLLGVKFDSMRGESAYEDRLAGVVCRALQHGVARREQPAAAMVTGGDEVGADETVVIIPLDDAGIETPLILQKSDGTSLYATRELATAEYRIERWHPEKMLYVVGKEQELYFRQFSAALTKLGIGVPCIHVTFGLVRLPEGRMSTREGRVVFLEDVITEAIRRAEAVVQARELSVEEKTRISRIVGIGAIKYADLSQSRIKEVVFDWNRMLALDGDSAPYLQYAYTRTRSILRKAPDFRPADFTLHSSLFALSEEISLLRSLARFPDAVVSAAESYEPHRIAGRIYRIARDFSAFYDKAPVLKAETAELRDARLFLVEMTGKVLATGLALLGIEVADRM